MIYYGNKHTDPEDANAMYKNCHTEQSAARQRKVEQQLLRELELRHYEDITVSDLCQSTGISRKCFYRYFSGKQGVLDALLDHTILQGDMAFSTEPLGDPSAGLTVFFQFWKYNRLFLDTLNRSELIGALVDRAVVVYREAYVSKHDSGSQELKNLSCYQIEFLISGLMRMMLRWYRDGFPLPVGQMAAATILLTSAFSFY